MRKIKRRREGQANETLQVYLVNTHGEILVPVTIKSLVCYRYLQICRVINFMPGIARAHFYLGDIESQFKRYKTALVEFEDSLAAAKECNDTTIQTLCTVEIGICKGTLQLKELADNVEAQSIFDNTDN